MGTQCEEIPSSSLVNIDLKVCVQDSCLVFPNQETQTKSMFLSNIDQVLNFNVETVHFFAPDKIKKAMEKILVPYDLMAGRLKFKAKTGRLEIDCNRARAAFVVASSDCTLDEIGDLVYPNPAFAQLVINTNLDHLDKYGKPLCIIQGLLNAISELLPQVEHRMCARHIYANWAKKWRVDERKRSFWAVARSTFRAQLKFNLDELNKLGKGIVEDALNYPMQTWIKMFFSTDINFDVVDNNLSETFNGWILESRSKPIISMLEDIRIQVMKRLVNKRHFVQTWIHDVSPRVM